MSFKHHSFAKGEVSANKAKKGLEREGWEVDVIPAPGGGFGIFIRSTEAREKRITEDADKAESLALEEEAKVSGEVE